MGVTRIRREWQMYEAVKWYLDFYKARIMRSRCGTEVFDENLGRSVVEEEYDACAC